MCESVSYYFSFGFYQCFNAKDVEDAFGSKTRDQVDEANKELDEVDSSFISKCLFLHI